MTRTEAPKVFGGRLDLNLARTTPELPVQHQYLWVAQLRDITNREDG